MIAIIPDADFICFATEFINRADLIPEGIDCFDVVEPSARYCSPPRIPGQPVDAYIPGKRMARFERVNGKWVFRELHKM